MEREAELQIVRRAYARQILAAFNVANPGRVVAYEFDAELAERARANLAPLANVEVVHGTRSPHPSMRWI
jgi:protein-L-isoaspartate O-methyltransferase